LVRSAAGAAREVGIRARERVREPPDPDRGSEPGAPSLQQWLYRGTTTAFMEAGLTGAAAAARMLPIAQPRLHGIEVLRDLSYRPTGSWEHALDVYRPRQREHRRPVVLYIHGGGFRILSKESHWIMGLMFARRGCVVLNINYRLAPRHPFPAAIEDACRAYLWTLRNVEALGGDPRRLVLAGDSAGANLVTALTLCTVRRLPMPWAAAVFDAGVVPKAVLPASGLLQVTDIRRLFRKLDLPRWMRAHLLHIAEGYVPEVSQLRPEERILADPLPFLEERPELERALPPFLISTSTGDPIQEDSQRLHEALEALGVASELLVARGEPHAFHATVVTPGARRYWRKTRQFLEKSLGPG
jgi:acetyl esterase